MTAASDSGEGERAKAFSFLAFNFPAGRAVRLSGETSSCKTWREEVLSIGTSFGRCGRGAAWSTSVFDISVDNGGLETGGRKSEDMVIAGGGDFRWEAVVEYGSFDGRGSLS